MTFGFPSVSVPVLSTTSVVTFSNRSRDAADANAWPALPEPVAARGVGLADWRAVEERWRHTLDALATEVREGVAAVAPRDVRVTCQRCRMQSLCRIGVLAQDGDTENGDA